MDGRTMMPKPLRRTASEARRPRCGIQFSFEAGRTGVILRRRPSRPWAGGDGGALHRRFSSIRAGRRSPDAWLGHVRQTRDRTRSWATGSRLDEGAPLVVLACPGWAGSRARFQGPLLDDLIRATAQSCQQSFAPAKWCHLRRRLGGMPGHGTQSHKRGQEA